MDTLQLFYQSSPDETDHDSRGLRAKGVIFVWASYKVTT